MFEKSSRSGLYPVIEPTEIGMLQVSEKHSIFYEVSGNTAGQPVLFAHGGPGGATRPDHRRFFDPNAYRIILFDQRGCGKSTPRGCLEENTTNALIKDMESLRQFLKIQSWGIFGGSWGSTLTIAYAQAYPERVRFVCVRGIFMARKAELAWFYERTGAALLFPSLFKRYLAGLPVALREAPSILRAYHSILVGLPSAERDAAAKAWCEWESGLSRFPGPPVERTDKEAEVDAGEGIEPAGLVVARLEAHYFVHGAFFERDGLLLDPVRMKRIRGIPAAIVQGRWDMVCPVRTAHDLANAWPEARFEVIDHAGHSAFEAGTTEMLVAIMDEFRKYGDDPGVKRWVIDTVILRQER